MPVQELPKGYDGVDKLPRTYTNLQNCVHDGKRSIVPRLGITQLNTTGKVARGQFKWNDDLYQVVSTDLIRITDVETGTFETIATIEGSANIQTDIGCSSR